MIMESCPVMVILAVTSGIGNVCVGPQNAEVSLAYSLPGNAADNDNAGNSLFYWKVGIFAYWFFVLLKVQDDELLIINPPGVSSTL